MINRNDLVISNRIKNDICAKFGIKIKYKPQMLGKNGYWSFIIIEEIGYIYETPAFVDKDELTIHENDIIISQVENVLSRRKIASESKKETAQEHDEFPGCPEGCTCPTDEDPSVRIGCHA